MSSYDPIARLYDPWSRSVTEDVAFYLSEARRAEPPVVELGVGTGRIAVPIAAQGIRLIGVDSSPGMLEVCRERSEQAGVAGLVELRLGDLRAPPSPSGSSSSSARSAPTCTCARTRNGSTGCGPRMSCSFPAAA